MQLIGIATHENTPNCCLERKRETSSVRRHQPVSQAAVLLGNENIKNIYQLSRTDRKKEALGKFKGKINQRAIIPGVVSEPSFGAFSMAFQPPKPKNSGTCHQRIKFEGFQGRQKK